MVMALLDLTICFAQHVLRDRVPVFGKVHLRRAHSQHRTARAALSVVRVTSVTEIGERRA